MTLDQKAAERRDKLIQAHQAGHLEVVLEAVQERLESKELILPPSLDSPNWAVCRAFRDGQVEALRDILKTLNLPVEIEKMKLTSGEAP